MSARQAASPWRQTAGRLGVPGLAGVSLGLLVGWGWLVWLPSAQAELTQAQDRAAMLRRQLQAGADPRTTAMPGGTEQAADALWPGLWASLPPAADATQRQGRLLDAAASRGLMIQTVQYRGAALKGLPAVWRQQVSLPVEAPYPAVRAWLGWILQQPALSLDAVDIARSDPMSEVVKARVQVSFWWRMDLPTAAATTTTAVRAP